MAILRDVLRDEADDGSGSGGAGGDTKVVVVPGPGETQDSMVKDLAPVKGDVDDKGDKVDDEAAAAAKKIMEDAEKAAEAKANEGKTPEEIAAAEKAAEEKKAADDKAAADAKISVPKTRMDAALIRARKAEEENAALRAEAAKAAAAPAKAADEEETITIAEAEKRIDALDLEIAKAMKDEDDEDGTKAAALLREQRELRDGIQEARDVDTRAETSAQTAEEIQFDRVVNDLESRIPVIDPDHEDFNQELTDETVTLAKALKGQGYTQGDSMLLAVDYMSEKLGIKADVVKDVKKETNIEKNVAAANKLPPDTPGAKGVASDEAGITPDSANAMGMSDDEFEALRQNPGELARLRGDFVT